MQNSVARLISKLLGYSAKLERVDAHKKKGRTLLTADKTLVGAILRCPTCFLFPRIILPIFVSSHPYAYFGRRGPLGRNVSDRQKDHPGTDPSGWHASLAEVKP